MYRNKKIIIIVASLLALGGASYAYYKNSRPYSQNPSGEYVTEDAPSSTEKGQSQKEKSQKNQQETNTSYPEPNKSTNNVSTTSSLYKPTGNFVSSHTVEPDSTIESVCVTTPGARCKIILTNGSKIKILNEKTTGRQGNTAWIWQPKKIGINSGKWQVKAVASMNGQTKETKDAKLMEVI
jgi:uncharacterized protein YxeA